MKITDYHAKYFAHELTKRFSSDKFEKIASTLIDARVDLNPHQVDAALFAFYSPLSKGAILADEVGLGKTIEAGIVISQKWAERKRKILIIVPSSLRKQWSQELQEKFFISSSILEAKSFNEQIKKGNLNPFIQENVVITSLHFARNKAPYIKSISWDLVIIDEAHRLRNVYKPSNKIAKAIKDAIMHAPKLLLTATPLQNSLLELYGLVSIIDDFVFGDLKSYKIQFSHLDDTKKQFADLKNRLKPICKRTLRQDVHEYIQYTNRQCITQEFIPYNDEQILYDKISEYLQRPNPYALPASQRKLMTMILRRLLSSSSFAIAVTLENLVKRLKILVEKQEQNQAQEELFATEISSNYEALPEIADEWVDDEEEEGEEKTTNTDKPLTKEDLIKVKEETTELEQLASMAKAISRNSKGDSLVKALRMGFTKIKELGGQQKALIFTESTRTQQYILDILSATEYKDKIVLFNGTNADPLSRKIYKEWLERNKNTDEVSGSMTADKRAAVVEYFKNEATIMVATEAAAEGINLQFCSLVVNFDLPWNPQRIEQRIGRCHRYGQKNDVVVVNFLNKKNEADIRVYEILSEKFKLFDGVFGATDEVLGVIESGVDFEKRIAEILQNCRTPEEIKLSFDTLRKELDEQIDETMKSTRRKLLENFDEEVHQKLRLYKAQTEDYLSIYEDWLWKVTRHYLEPFAVFEGEFSFYLNKNPFPQEIISPGPYKLGKNISDAHVYRVGHPLAAKVIEKVKEKQIEDASLIFDYSNSGKKISILERYIGKSGWLIASSFTISALEEEDYVVLSAIDDDKKELDDEQCKRMFSLPAKVQGNITLPLEDFDLLQQVNEYKKTSILKTVSSRNSKYFEIEMEKLEKWADDVKESLEIQIKQLDKDIKTLKTESKRILKLEDKVQAYRHIKDLEKKRKTMRQQLFDEQDRAEERKDKLLSELEGKIKQSTRTDKIFAVRWTII